MKLDPKQDKGIGRTFSLAAGAENREFTLSGLRLLAGGRVESYGNTLRNVIRVAYEINVPYRRVVGEQDVLDAVVMIEAKAAAPSLTAAEAKAMVRTLLEERFQLRWRLQPREVDGYSLMPAREDGRPGPGLRSFTGDCEVRARNAPVRSDSPDYEQQARCGWTGINARQRAVGVSTTAIAERMVVLMGTPVVDRTAWAGLYTFDMLADTVNMPGLAAQLRPAGLGPPLAVDAPYFLEAFRNELGLKLVKDRTTVNDFVVERVEPLIEN